MSDRVASRMHTLRGYVDPCGGNWTWVAHFVADPALGEDVGRVGRVIAELGPELIDHGSHAVVVVRPPAAPDLAEERPGGHDPSGLEGEDAQPHSVWRCFSSSNRLG